MKASKKYVHNYGILRKYTDNEFKLTCMNFKCVKDDEIKFFTPKGFAGNEEKLENNISRTKTRICELGKCNKWDFFVTLTLDPKKYDRKDLARFNKNLSQFIRDERKKGNGDIIYLFIPERHKDGCWHMHGFLGGLSLDCLHEFSRDEHLPKKILNKIDNGVRVFTWKKYENKFGFADIELLQNKEAAFFYITKYVTKELMKSVKELNAHAFYASKGLKSSEVLHQDILPRGIENPTYSNEYVSVKMFDDLPSALSFFEVRV